MKNVSTIIEFIDSFNEHLGRVVSWLCLGMVVMMFINVVQRYLLASGEPWQQEVVAFMHAIVFLAAAGYTLKHDGHVRVDVFYHTMSERRKAWVELLGTLFLLWPVCMALAWFSSGFILDSWKIYEGSNEYHGMPGVFALKTFIWVFCTTLMLQGLSVAGKALITLTEKEPTGHG